MDPAIGDRRRQVTAFPAGQREPCPVTTVAMVRKGGQAIFYGGAPRGTSVRLDTQAVHYDQLTIQGIFHTTPFHVRQALALLADPTLPWQTLITTTLPLARLADAFDLMISRQALKVALVPDTTRSDTADPFL